MPEHIRVRELADLLGLRTLKVVAELLGLHMFKNADEVIDFPTAAIIGSRYGFAVERSA